MSISHAISDKATRFLLVTVLLAGCAFGERFGLFDDDDAPPGSGCTVNSDCHDGDPLTIDICGADGICEHISIPADSDPDLADPVDVCDVAQEIGYTGEVFLDLDAVTGNLSHALPLVQGTVVRLVLRERKQLRILTATKLDDGLVFVLLSDCANAASNRLDWGRDIQSPILDKGEYYLAVFSNMPKSIAIDIHYLEPVTCADALPLSEGENTGTVDGYCDSFTGSCLPEGPAGHRGNRVYSFTIPEGEISDLHAHLFVPGAQPAHYLFLRGGCGGDDALEIACESQGQEPFDSGYRTENAIVLEALGLEPGAYYLFVGGISPDQFDLGDYRLEAYFSSLR